MAQGVRAVLEAIVGQLIQISLPRRRVQCETQWGNFHGLDAAAADRCSGVQASGGSGRVVVVVVVVVVATGAGAVTALVFNLAVVAPRSSDVAAAAAAAAIADTNIPSLTNLVYLSI